MIKEFDSSRAKELLIYLGRSQEKLDTYEKAKNELKELVEELKQKTTDSALETVKELENKLDQVREHEQELLLHPGKGVDLYGKLRDKLESFQQNLKKTINLSNVADPEKIKKAKLHGILEGMEILGESLKGIKGISKEKMQDVHDKIKLLKKRVK